MLTRLEYQPKDFSAKLLLRKELHQNEIREMPPGRYVPGQTNFKERKLIMTRFLLSKFQVREVVDIQNTLFLRRLDGNPDKNLPVSVTTFKKSSLQ